ncbi:heat shock protein 70 (hsp70)-interacting protein, putative [Schistosoma mansoni]|uniref:heat shock protein 70 (hsp70)-interacting protein, putative n=1 Tax=Schistosoma mansoni TaxID=6183 RepID=UPI00022C8565|nr:heat shock protein 70 (hsp70)-interacting protein, putative [Schistosoma mansoni]|eukprot:XP_018645780.1 heat shock protein 70 (hsp70)-interacting protein, putative [Schistosoma mansoni]
MKNLIELKTEANELFKKGLYREAIGLYDECLGLCGSDKSMKLVLQRNKAQCFLNLGNFSDALTAALEALSISPGDPKALYRCAQAYEGKGMLKEALETGRRLILVDPRNKAAQDLTHKLETSVASYVAESESLTGKLKKMFAIVNDNSSSAEELEKAIVNLSILIKENPKVASSMIWTNPSFSKIYSVCRNSNHKLTIACHRLLAQIVENERDWGLTVLHELTPQYFVNGIFSRNPEHSLERCRFLNAILESLTQLKAYHSAKEAASVRKEIESKKVAPCSYPKYKIDSTVEKPVEEILTSLLRSVNSYRLCPKTRDYILEILVRYVPSDKGIGWSQKIFKIEGVIDSLLEVACASGITSLKNWRSSRINKHRNNELISNKHETSCQNSPDGIRLATTSDTRMTVACLLAKIWDDLTSDKSRDEYTKICKDFIIELFADNYIESKVEAASVIGTLFLGPYEVGSGIISQEGVFDGLLLLTQCENKLYQALCKLGAAGGTDASVKSLTEGSNVLLLKACRRLLLGKRQPDPDVDDIAANKSADVHFNSEGEVVVDENDDEIQIEEVSASQPVENKKDNKPVNGSTTSTIHFDDLDSAHWAVEGMAYITMNADVKEEIINDGELVSALLSFAEHCQKDSSFALCSVLAHLTNSFERQQIEPEILELAKFSKQHIPEDHPYDSDAYIQKRRQKLINMGLASSLYQLTMRIATTLVGSNQGLSELISRIYLACSELVECRGKLVQSGAGKALLKLSKSDFNTDTGKTLASQALARLTITADPRVTFPGQKSLELVRPLLHLIHADCNALQNFEGLLALTNLASLGDTHRYRIMAEHGLPLIDHCLFEDHPMIRRAATECVANLAQSHSFVISSGERVKLLVLYCGELDDLLLVRAASGALASMSYDPGIIKKITNVSSWFEIIQTLAGHFSCALQHRAAHILQNFILHGERSLGEYFCKSNMFEVLLSLSLLPDIDPADQVLPDIRPLYPGCSDGRIRELEQKDREGTRECAKKALERLKEHGFVQKTPNQ